MYKLILSSYLNYICPDTEHYLLKLKYLYETVFYAFPFVIIKLLYFVYTAESFIIISDMISHTTLVLCLAATVAFAAPANNDQLDKVSSSFILRRN